MASVRDTASIGIRSKDLTEIEYGEFMIEIVNHGCLLNDPVTATAFEKSLDDKTRNVAMKLLQKEARTLTVADLKSARASAPIREVKFDAHQQIDVIKLPKPAPFFDPEASTNYQKANAALIDLGYKKPQAKKILDNLGPEVDKMTIEELVKVCLQRIAS